MSEGRSEQRRASGKKRTYLSPRLAWDPALGEAITWEPAVTWVLARCVRPLPRERFQRYAEAKRAAASLVGFGVADARLRTRAHYEAVITCAAWLLGIDVGLAAEGDGERLRGRAVWREEEVLA